MYAIKDTTCLDCVLGHSLMLFSLVVFNAEDGKCDEPRWPLSAKRLRATTTTAKQRHYHATKLVKKAFAFMIHYRKFQFRGMGVY